MPGKYLTRIPDLVCHLPVDEGRKLLKTASFLPTISGRTMDAATLYLMVMATSQDIYLHPNMFPRIPALLHNLFTLVSTLPEIYIADDCFTIILVYMTIKERELVSDMITFLKDSEDVNNCD